MPSFRLHVSPWIFFAVFCCMSVACQESTSEPAPEESFFKEYMGLQPQALSTHRPPFLSEFGRHDHQLDDISLAGQQRNIQLLRTHRDQIAALPPLQDTVEQIRREAELWSIEQVLADEPFLLYEDPVNPFTGFHPRLLQAFHDVYLGDKEEVEAYVARMKAIPNQVRAVMDHLEKRKEAGIISPRFLLDKSKEELQAFLDSSPDQNPLYRGLALKLNRVDPTELNLYEAADFLEVAEQNLDRYVFPAYQRLLDYLDKLDATDKEAYAFADLPKAEAYYAHLLSKHSGMRRLDPKLLLSQLQGKLDSLQALIQDLEKTQATLPAAEPLLKLSDRNKIEQVQFFASQMRNSRQDLISVFDSLPHRSPEIMIRPEYMPQVAALQYEPASLDKMRQSRIVVDFAAWDKLSAFEQKSHLYAHVFPGAHSLQELSNPNKSYHSIAPYAGWTMGWENYAVRLAHRPMYLFDAGNHLLLGYQQQQAELLALAILDLGLHSQNWTHKQAEQFLSTKSYMNPSEQEDALLHASAQPGWLAAQYIGTSQFYQLANYAQVRFPEKVNYKIYHRICLNHGPLPWFLLQRLINFYGGTNLARKLHK